jgi:hypothetical protein
MCISLVTVLTTLHTPALLTLRTVALYGRDKRVIALMVAANMCLVAVSTVCPLSATFERMTQCYSSSGRSLDNTRISPPMLLDVT